MHASTQTDTSLFTILRWVLSYALHRWVALVIVVASLLLKVGLDVLKPWPMLFLVDYVLRPRTQPEWVRAFIAALPGAHSPEALIGWSVGATILLFLLGWAIGLGQTCAGINLGQRMVYDLAADVFAQLQRLSLRFHGQRTVGDSMRRVSADCTCIATVLRDAVLPAASAGVSLTVMFFILWQLSPSLTLLALSVIPFMLLTFHRYAQPMLNGSYQQQEIEGRIYEVVEQTFSSMPVVQAFCRERLNEERFVGATSEALAVTLSLTRLQLRFKILMGLSTALGTSAILWFGTRLALDGQFSVGAILLFLSYLGSLYAPLEAVFYSTSTIQGASGSAQRVREVLEARCEVADRPRSIPLPKVSGQVLLENVTFGYEPERPVLHDISLQALPGETIALVGATGAGKSTLVSLIPRFFDPWSGRVIIDGCDVRDVKLKSLRSQVGIVLQEPFLFPLTIGENIAYGRPKATLGEIEAAARAANAHEFIVKLPNGYQTVIGERGATLSVGQRQRLSIARALLKNAPILILDEPTSALDNETELALLGALQHLVHDRTTFIIAHRLSTVRRADRLVVLSEGRIVEAGTHGQLMAAGGIFARFHSLQFGPSQPPVT